MLLKTSLLHCDRLELRRLHLDRQVNRQLTGECQAQLEVILPHADAVISLAPTTDLISYLMLDGGGFFNTLPF